MSKLLLKAVVGLLFHLFFCSNLYAQPGKFNQFYMFLTRTKIAPQWTITALAQYRSYDTNITDSRLFLINTYVDYKLKNAPVQFGAGYMYLQLLPYDEFGIGKNLNIENRIFQQVTIGHKLSERLSLSQRYRFEERFVFSDQFILRARHLLTASYKLGDPKDSKISLIAKDEIRMNIDKESAFDSFRLWAGVGIKLTESWELEPYWMSQFESTGIFSYAVLSLRKSFDLTKNNNNKTSQ